MLYMFYLFLVYTTVNAHMASFDDIKLCCLYLCNQLEGKEDITTDTIATMERNRINGRTFINLNRNDLKKMFPVLGDRKAVERDINSIKPTPPIVSICTVISLFPVQPSMPLLHGLLDGCVIVDSLPVPVF